MTDYPSVSVIMPHYRQEWFLNHALRSVAVSAARYPGEVEIILVHDGHPDPGFDLRPVAGLTVDMHAHNRGAASAINAGVERAEGDLLTWVSADNLMHPDWLWSLGAMLQRESVGVAYASFWWQPADRIYMRGLAIHAEQQGAAFWDSDRLHQAPVHIHRYPAGGQITQEACVLGPAHLMRREVWADHPPGINHDLGHFLRVEEFCHAQGLSIEQLDTPLCLYFAHQERATVQKRHEYHARALLAEAVKRRGLQ